MQANSYLTDTWADTDIHWEGDSWNEVGTNLYGCLKQLYLLKKKNRSLKILLSVGGWTYSSNFAAPASTAAGREKFATSCVQLVKDLGLDGIDVDWEYPKTLEEGHNFAELLGAVRKALDEYASKLPGEAKNYHFELTVACPAGEQNYKHLPLGEMDRHLDFWNLMAYDYAGSWDSVVGHQANLHACHGANAASTPFSTDAAVEAYTTSPHHHGHHGSSNGGVHPSKIILGMPLYGRAFENTDGLGKPYQGVGQGSWEQGVYDYKALPLPGHEERLDHEAGASYSYGGANRTLVSYDTPEMAARKAAWIREKGLGGGMWWESSADKVGPGQSLIEVVVQGLGGKDKLRKSQRNCLAYPESKYDNLKNGMPNSA